MNPIALNSTLLNAARPANVSKHDALTKQVQKWVGQTFYGTLLKQAHESPFKDKLFSGGRGGEAFGSMQDSMLAEHMSRGVGSKIVRAIVRKVEAKRAYEKAGSGDRVSGIAEVQSALSDSRAANPKFRNPKPQTRASR